MLCGKCQVTSTWRAGPKVSKQNIAKSIKLSPSASHLPIVHPGAMCSSQVSNANAPSHPHDLKENGIHQTRPSSSIAQWSSSDAHILIIGDFSGGRGQRGHPDWSTAMQPHIQNNL